MNAVELAPADETAWGSRALALVARFVGACPKSMRAALAALLAWIAGSLLRIRRAHVETAMTRAGVPLPRETAASMYRALGQGAVELLALSAPGAGDRALDAVVIAPSSRARWQALVAAGRGIVVAASHTGNWDLAACAVARDVELVVVTKRLSVRAFDTFWQRARLARGVRLIEATGSLGVARATLARGGAVAMMIDQVPLSMRHAVHVDFLGAPAFADRAPAALAARSGAPLVVAAAERTASGQLLHVLDVFEPPARERGAWIAWATREATRALERFIVLHPEGWLWLHRRWRAPPPG